MRKKPNDKQITSIVISAVIICQARCLKHPSGRVTDTRATLNERKYFCPPSSSKKKKNKINFINTMVKLLFIK